MKKTVLAVAVGAALAAAGVAQAETAIFGAANMSIDQIDNGTDSYVYVNSNDSAIGFKGGEEIEGGLKAMWYFEQGVSMDGGSTTSYTLFNKNTYVGLGGGFGEVKIGKIDSLVKQLGRKADLFVNQMGDSRAITSKYSTADARPGDQIVYTSPKLGPVTLALAFIPEDGKKDASAVAFSALIGLETMTFGVGYESYGKCYTACGTATTGEDESTIRGIGSMKFGPATVNFLVQSTTGGKGVTTAAGKSQDYTAYGVGGAFKVGNGNIKAQVYSASETDNIKKNEGTLIAIGYDHSLSKATTVYAVVAAASNGDAGTYTVSGGGHAVYSGDSALFTPVAGDDASGVSLGVSHKF